MQIQTVKGPSDVNKPVIADSHVHVWAKKDNTVDTLGEVTNLETIMTCLKNFKSAGGNLIVDCTPQGCGRDANVLYELSKRMSIDVVCTTGFHLKKYYLPHSKIWESSIDEAYNFFIGEIKNGLKETLGQERKIKPGIIKIPFMGSLSGIYKTLTDAAIQASLETGVPLLIHTEKGIEVEWFADYLEKAGIKPQQVVFCHIDKRNDIKIHIELAQRGYYLEYDTFLRAKYEPEKNVYRLMKGMLDKGFKNSIMIGTDIADNAMWESIASGVGYANFFIKLKKYLVENFQDFHILSSVIGENTARFLSLK